MSERRLSEIEQQLEAVHPELLAAADEVDETLIEWALSLGPFERVRACSRAARALAKWTHATPGDG